LAGNHSTAPSGILVDAYGTLFDVYSLGTLAEELFPRRGAALATLWREKQLDYSRLRTLCDRYVDFLTITKDALNRAGDPEEWLGLLPTGEARSMNDLFGFLGLG
jgi:FMN phosphatase YigB (HAD superfamily)